VSGAAVTIVVHEHKPLGRGIELAALAGLLGARDVQPVRQVAVDGTWSALRFLPA
jgi:hypothetical protein